MIQKDGKKYYTLEESIKISDENIEKSADKMILELRKRKQSVISKDEMYV